MKAIWRGNLWIVSDTDGPAGPGRVMLTHVRTDVAKSARLNDPGLILDPTDDQIADYCQTCGSPAEECGGNCDAEQPDDDAIDCQTCYDGTVVCDTCDDCGQRHCPDCDDCQ